jgi:predicted metal-dependent hydrolase
LQVRRPPFRIDETVPFQWQPSNPAFGLFTNTFTFLAIAFERYIVSATRQAIARIDDPAVRDEAEAFLRQEAQHARAHRAHAKALIARYPGLEQTLAAVTAAYDELLEQQDLEFHLAYIANLEATFTPLFKMVLDHRGPLFAGGDERVGTLFLWHFVEEIEHRSSALVVHHHVTPDRWYRLRQAPRTLGHVARTYGLVLAGIDRHVPLEDRGLPTSAVSPMGLWLNEVRTRLPVLRRRHPGPSMLAHVPGRELGSMLRRLALSQTPRHDPGAEPLPAWAGDWHDAFDHGDDVTTYPGARL